MSAEEINSWSMQQSQKLQSLKEKLADKESFPRSNRILSLEKFVAKNLKIHSDLISAIEHQKEKIESQRSKRAKISPECGSHQNSTNADTDLQKQSQLLSLQREESRERSEVHALREELAKMEELNRGQRERIASLMNKEMNRSIHETPMLRQKQEQIELGSIEIEALTDKQQCLRRIINSKDVFQEYEKMCRECESVRNQNNQLSEELRVVFERQKKVTGKQENVNMFLMNLKV